MAVGGVGGSVHVITCSVYYRMVPNSVIWAANVQMFMPWRYEREIPLLSRNLDIVCHSKRCFKSSVLDSTRSRDDTEEIFESGDTERKGL